MLVAGFASRAAAMERVASVAARLGAGLVGDREQHRLARRGRDQWHSPGGLNISRMRGPGPIRVRRSGGLRWMRAPGLRAAASIPVPAVSGDLIQARSSRPACRPWHASTGELIRGHLPAR